MVTLILMIVISLVVLGFAQISRRNQRQALDRQLSTQAFYAAETGVNDASQLIKAALESGSPVASKDDCASTGGGFYSSLNPVIDSSASVEYTCLMVDPTPNSLVYSSIGVNSTVVPLIASSGTISSVRFTWQSKDTGTTPADSCPTSPSGVFTRASSWNCGYGVLRLDLVPTAGPLSMDGLRTSTMTTFAVPLRPGSSGTSSVSYTTGGGNNRLGVTCSNSNCSLTVNFPSPSSQYYMRVSSIYKDVSLQVAASDGGDPVGLQGAQAVVDATGKAQDVLRRIQVRVPLVPTSSNLLSDYAVQSTEAICKRFSVMNGFFNSEANDAVSGVSSGTNNPLCD
jgi:type II secretory pathway pseudopilin PulG